MKRLSPAELDQIGLRLEEIEAEEEALRARAKEQVEEFGSIPPRAEKSKRLSGDAFQFTVSISTTTEIKDAEVERIRAACTPALFAQLFIAVLKYKLAKGATALLAGTLPEAAPRNLRMMFSRAVEMKEGAPRLRMERIEVLHDA